LKVFTNASDMPFDCGLRTGVKQGTRPKRIAKSIVSWARYALPLSESHWMGAGSERYRSAAQPTPASDRGSSPR